MNETPFTPEGLLSHANTTVTTSLLRFMRKVSVYHEHVIYCIVEGYDLPYYNVRIEAISGEKCEFIEANGKKNVIALYNIIKSRPEYSNLKQLYFVDQDYDTNESIPDDIYITLGYSVENFYVSKNSYIKILEGIFHIDITNPKFSKCEKLFDDRLKDFIYAVKDFCAWYRFIRINGIRASIRLGESFPSEYAKIEISGIQRENYSIVDLNNAYPDVPDVTQEQLDQELTNIDTMSIRGKYVLQFIESIISFLVKDSKNGKIYSDSKIEFESNRKTLLTRLSAYADTPDCLRKYILNYSA